MQLLERIQEIQEAEWGPVNGAVLAASSAVILVIAWLGNTGQRWVWTEIFSRWDALQQDTAIAGFVRLIGWIGVLASWSWLAWCWWRGREDD